MEWIIIVAQIVVGKSKFPHKKVGRFSRHKPWPYYDSNIPHRILYTRKLLGDKEYALEKAKYVDQEMFNTYVLGMKNTSSVCVSDYTVVLHNITEDKSYQMSTTINDKFSRKENYLFEDTFCTNKNLGIWKIVEGL